MTIADSTAIGWLVGGKPEKKWCMSSWIRLCRVSAVPNSARSCFVGSLPLISRYETSTKLECWASSSIGYPR